MAHSGLQNRTRETAVHSVATTGYWVAQEPESRLPVPWEPQGVGQVGVDAVGDLAERVVEQGDAVESLAELAGVGDHDVGGPGGPDRLQDALVADGRGSLVAFWRPSVAPHLPAVGSRAGSVAR